jgi:hypothetical protein
VVSFRLVQREGVDTLHRDPSYESCQVDDATSVLALKLSMAEAHRIADPKTGSAQPCKHCQPLSQSD